MIRFYYIATDNKVLITKSIYTTEQGAILLGQYTKKVLPQTYNSWLKQYKLSDGTLMFSNDLLMVVAKIVKVDYEDLWNLIYMRSDHLKRSDRSKREFFSSREEELFLNDAGIFNVDV
jgi:hypothetical protein